MYAKQVLEAMSDLKVSMTRPDTHDYLESFIFDMARKGDLPLEIEGNKYEPDPNSVNGARFGNGQEHWLSMSDAYLVDADMMKVIRWAATSLEATDSFEHDLWPSDYGFLVFEEPMIVPDRWGHNMVTKAISWGRYSAEGHPSGRRIPGMLLTSYVDTHDLRDEVTVRALDRAREEYGEDGARRLSNHWAGMGRYHVNHIAFIPDGRRVGPPLVTFDDDTIARRKAFVSDIETGEHVRSIENNDRTILAMLMLMQQTVSARRTEAVPPKSAARYTKRRLPHQITVITLRRISGANRAEGESHVEWAHRWIVKGHWRNQPYKGEAGSTVYRKIWIAPFLKGPEDKPFKVTDKVYRLSR